MSRRRKKRAARPNKGAVTLALATSMACGNVNGNSASLPSLPAASAAPTERDAANDGTTNAAPALKRLVTTFDSDRSSAGAMFDVKAKRSVIIRGVDINTVRTRQDGESRVEIWTKGGTFRGYESSRDAWTLWANETISGSGLDVPTRIPPGAFPPVAVPARERRAFYVAFPDGPYLRHGLQGDDGRLYYVNRDLFVYGNGAAKGRRGFGGATFYPRLFSGAVRYETIPDAIPANEVARQGPTPRPTPDPSKPETRTMSTTFESSVTYAGGMFDVLAKDDIEISSVAFNTYKTSLIPVWIYTKEGSHRGHDKDLSRWTLLAGPLNVKGMGMGEPTYLPEGSFEPVLVRRNRRMAFYVTSDGPYLRAARSASNEVGRVAEANSDLIIYEGAGKRYPVEGSTFAPRVWNGALRYRVVDVPTLAPTTSKPTKRPTLRPTRQPTPRPTPKPSPRPTRWPTPRPTKRPTLRPTPRPVAIPTGPSYRLRLYWQPGYYWQESREEMWFCMECRDNCRAGDSVYVDECVPPSPDRHQRFLWTGDGTLRPERDASLCLTVTGYSEEEPIRVYDCGGSRWKEQRFEGFRTRGRFELRPQGESEQCVSQMHHPKKFERIYPEYCHKTRSHDTTYWIVY